MGTELERIAEIARRHHDDKMTELVHKYKAETLKECYRNMERGKAAGVDGVSWDEYGTDLDGNVERLMERMKKGAYRPQPVRRVYIPKPGSDKMRPLGIP